MKIHKMLLCFFCFALITSLAKCADKPKLTLDEFFNSVSFDSVKASPDGHSVVVAMERPDWDEEIFRTELWLYRDADGSAQLTPLTQSGYDSGPEWSPDGRWIAFFSERKLSRAKSSSGDDSAGDQSAQVYLIPPTGGEAFPVTSGDEAVHAFAWSADSRTLFYATRQPWTKEQKDDYKNTWKDVVQYRAAERGDMIFAIDVAEAIARHAAEGSSSSGESESATDVTPGSRSLAKSPWRINGLAVSPDGHRLAFTTESQSEREERIDEFEVYSVDLANPSPDRPPRQVTHNQAQEQHLRWSADARHVFFDVEEGSVEGKYKDTQPRLYWVDVESGEVDRWAGSFDGTVVTWAPSLDGGALIAGRLGTEVQLYSQATPAAPLTKLSGWPGTYEIVAAALHSPRVAFVHSTLQQPTEVYVADSAEKISSARPITAFNKIFTERDLPQGKPYHWTADDGTMIEGMLMYPPGKFEAKNLPMFVFIHGGPNDADGNHFEADWYQWDRLAATQGWLVFEPNYRGSTGYGDRFLMQIVPAIVSRPGKDILEGVDALLKEGIADQARLTIGGYSYGGYMTDWLITQSTRWKAAVTGAGAVENVANWGNDDTTLDDAYFLGGLPWDQAKRYQDEAAIFQINKAHTPTHIVAGADDIRVAVAEDYLLDHALHNLGVPSTLLIFPGEGHSLGKNPWHGKIKVREELKWLAKYGGVGGNP